MDPSRSLQDQREDLKEDLAQVRYLNGLIVDVGWYPEFSEDGQFTVRVVADADWERPLFRMECSTISALMVTLRNACSIAAGASRAT